MDAGHKSKRLFPSMTTAELEARLRREWSEDRADIQLAIRQRTKGDPDYVPPFVVPQVTRLKDR